MIEIIFIVSFSVYFLYECTRKGMVFYFVSKSLKSIPDYLKKPLFDCPICMVPWWGPSIIAIGILGGVWRLDNNFQLIIVLSASAGLNTLINYLIEMGKAVSKSLNESECNCTKKSNDRSQRINQFISKSISK